MGQHTGTTELNGWQLAAIVATALSAGSALGGLNIEQTDFRTFYDAAREWRTGIAAASVAQGVQVNLNAPTFSIALAPLTWLAYPVAFWAWTALGLLACVSAAVTVQRTTPVSGRAWFWIVLVACGTMPWLFGLVLGQVTFVLLWLVTRAWASKSPLIAGVWLGIAIALKPPLALMALCLPLMLCVSAGLTASLITAIAIVVTGWPPWAEWLALSGHMRWMHLPTNLSIFGFAARLHSTPTWAPTIGEIALGWKLLAGALAVALWFHATRITGHRRWVFALMASLFLSPGASFYYLPLGAGAFIAGWPKSRLATAAVLVFAIPTPILALFADSHAGLVLIGLVYPIGACLLWFAFARDKKLTPV